MAQVIVLPAAEFDMLEQASFYDTQSDTTLGDRFLTACEEGFERLNRFPESGTEFALKHPRLGKLRFILVPGFDSSLIIYTFREETVRIVRVLHGKRDLERLLQ